MNQTGFLSWLRSNDDEIISSLERQGEILIKAVNALVEIMSDFGKIEGSKVDIEDLEHEGDKITHNLHKIMNKSFVTLLDKEDISALTGQIDQVIDYVDRLVGSIVLFDIDRPTEYMTELAKMLLSSSQEIFYLTKKLRGFKKADDILVHCQNISDYEHQADVIYRTAIGHLFRTDDAVQIIKMKEIYEILEGAHDRCADVADIFEDIALKYG
jgi:predicted phosphate transport protein (TIGR00153 family)